MYLAVVFTAVGDKGRARRRRSMELLLSRPTLPALYARQPALWHRGTVVTGLALRISSARLLQHGSRRLASAATQGADHACPALVEHD
jgi:hypothetical protein